MDSSKLDKLSDAYTSEFKFHDENIITLSWYADRLLKTLRARQPGRLLSLGIGHRVVASKVLLEIGSSVSSYHIVEGSREIVDSFLREQNLREQKQGEHLEVFTSMFELFTPQFRYDAIEMGFVLEHVDNPKEVVSQFSNYLKSDGILFIGVPNALSLHRRIGQQAGLLDSPYQLSEHDKQLGHQRYFDLDTLISLVTDCGLSVQTREGIYLKPVTTSQLKQLELVPEVHSALCKIAVKYPELANSIYIEASP